MANAFTPHDGCPVPSVEAITGSLVSSCSLKPIIDPIFEFPLYFPLPNPTDFDLGCVEWPSLKTTLNSDATVAGLTVHIRYPNQAETGTCAPSIEMELSTAACGKPAQLGEVNFVLPEDAGADVERTTEPCVLDWQYNFDFWRRCPRFELTGSVRLMNPWSSHSASYVGGQSASWWTLNEPSVHWDWSSSNAPSIDFCQFYASVDFYWPLVQSSFVAASFMTEEGATDVCLVELVKDFTAFSYSSDAHVLSLEYTVIPAFKVPMVASSVPCAGDCTAQICDPWPTPGPLGTEYVTLVYDLLKEAAMGCARTELAQYIEPVWFGAPADWSQDICYDWGSPWDCAMRPSPAACCGSYTLLAITDPLTPRVTGCSGSAWFQLESWTLRHDDWDIPDHFVKDGMADYGQPLQSIHIDSKEACRCALDAAVTWAQDPVHTYLYDFDPWLGNTSSMSLLSSWSCSSGEGVRCWFTELSFDRGILIGHNNYEGECRPAEMAGYCF